MILGYQADVALPATQLQLSIGRRCKVTHGCSRQSSLIEAYMHASVTSSYARMHVCFNLFHVRSSRFLATDRCEVTGTLR